MRLTIYMHMRDAATDNGHASDRQVICNGQTMYMHMHTHDMLTHL